MKFKVKIEEEDYIRYNIYIAFHSRAGRGALFRGRIFGLAISLFALLVMYVVKADRGLIMTEAAFLLSFQPSGSSLIRISRRRVYGSRYLS